MLETPTESRLRDQVARIPEVWLVYLYGSVARGDASERSDIDFGVYLDEGLTPLAMGRLRIELIGHFVEITRQDAVDLVVMNRASICQQFEVIKPSKPLFVRDESKRIDIEARIMSEYLDWKYYEETHAEIFLAKIRERGESLRV